MALDKNDISQTTDNYVKLLGKVKTACNDAVSKVRSCKESTDSNWEGESGTAMVDALYSLEKELQSLASEVADLQNRVRSRGSNISSNWVEESES